MTDVNYIQAQGKLMNAAYGGGVKAVYSISRGRGPMAELAQKVIDRLESNITLDKAVNDVIILNN